MSEAVRFAVAPKPSGDWARSPEPSSAAGRGRGSMKRGCVRAES